MNKICSIFIALLFIVTVLSGCSKNTENNGNTNKTYTVKSENNKFQGKLVSRELEQYEFDTSVYELQVSNGQKISTGTVLLALSETGKQSALDELDQEINITLLESKVSLSTDEMNCIQNGDYSSSETLMEEYDSLKEQQVELQNEIKAQEIVIEVAKINFDYSVAECKEVNETQENETQENQTREIEKLTLLYEKEQETNNIQLEKLKTQYSNVESKINNFNNSETVKNRLEELEEEISGYKDEIKKYNQRKEEISTDSILAKNDGLVVVDKGVIYVYSETVDFVLTTSTQNFEKFYSSKEKYELFYNNSTIGNLLFSYYVPSQTEDMYDLIYNIEVTDDVSLLPNTYAYMISEPEIFIPPAYISKNENGNFYVIKNEETVFVEAVLVEGQYKLISGLNIGDEIEKIN